MSYYKRATVTIDCHIFDSSTYGIVYLSTTDDIGGMFGSIGTLAGGLPDCVKVELLPEPVSFVNGDVVRSVIDGQVRVRIGGVWVWADGLGPTHFDDGYYADAVLDGSMTRVGLVGAA